ncbi:MAG: hypothetical protein GWP18_02060 [Proteobacteria bacterium]|nr:hypothetical protein [Pseudomonadota bacterium]
MTTNSSGGTSWTRNPWVWVAVGVAAVVVILFIVVNSGGGDDEAQATTTLPTSTTTTEATVGREYQDPDIYSTRYSAGARRHTKGRQKVGGRFGASATS